MFEFFKGIVRDDALYYSMLLLLIGVLSFGLGRFSVTEQREIPESQHASVYMVASSTAAGEIDDSQEVVASVHGTKYHLLWCPGASQMNEDNKIFFESFAEAVAAGYTKAANCPGL